MADTMDKLKELKEMLDSGLITKAEFDDLKAKELGLNDGASTNAGQQNDSVFVNQGVVNENNKNKKRGKGCLTVFLVFVGVIALIIGGLFAAEAGYDKKDRIEQERIDALEQIVDVNKYYFMPEEEVIALHGEPDKIKVVTENARSFTYDEGFTTAFDEGKCDIYIYRQQFEIEKMEDAFVLFGIVPDEKTMEVEWWDSTNEYFIKNVNDNIKYATIAINKSNPKYVELISVDFIE